ncbi:MAG: DUF6435 family protein [Planctomycetota bacterium]|jgi:hypothetical protein
MFGLFRRYPVRKVRRQYERKLRQARDLQRDGDVVAASRAYSEADLLRQKMEEMEKMGEMEEAEEGERCREPVREQAFVDERAQMRGPM